MESKLLGVSMIILGTTLIYLKIKRKWIFDEDKNLFEFGLSIQGWIGAIILTICGLFLLLGAK